jgi:membrane peptidoglycan carboxypeptidase
VVDLSKDSPPGQGGPPPLLPPAPGAENQRSFWDVLPTFFDDIPTAPTRPRGWPDGASEPVRRSEPEPERRGPHLPLGGPDRPARRPVGPQPRPGRARRPVPAPVRRRASWPWYARLALVVGLVLSSALVLYLIKGAAWALVAVAAELLVLAVARVALFALRWQPGTRLVARRLPLFGFLILVALIVIVPGRQVHRLWSAAMTAASTPLKLPVLTEGSTVYAADGKVAAIFHGAVNRQAVPLSGVAPVMVKAVIDTEDVRFYSHGGFDLYGTARAALHDLSGRAGLQGGSTLAMQLVKNTFLAGQDNGLSKKVEEAVLANRLETKIGKKGVLQEYLNTVYFGEGAYGVQAAAEEYFDLPASRLDTAQAALLAGMIQDPTGDDPITHPEAAAARRGEVLALMARYRTITPAAAAAAGATPVPREGHPPPNGDNYFMAAVRQELLADPALGPTPAARYQALYYGGLKIHTTLDPSLQADATRAVAAGIPQSPLHLSAALVSVDPNSGAVRAVVGGSNYAVSQFDAALASPGRPTGSSFKAFVLVAALAQGYSPDDYVDGAGPCTIPDPGNTPDPWVLNNYEGEASGWITITDATANSVNCAYARLALKVGLSNVADVARQMGIRAPLAVVPSMALGTNDVPPIQMASAYATLADDGVYHKPYLVAQVLSPDGKVLEKADSPGVRVVSSDIARTATQVLRSVVTSGTGTAAAIPGQDVVGKTGTGEDFSDAWFVGYTRYLSTAVWMGSPRGEVPMLGVDGIDVAGGTFPTAIWHSFMAAALAGKAPLPFPTPSRALPQPGQGVPGAGGYISDYSGGSRTSTTLWCSASCGYSNGSSSSYGSYSSYGSGAGRSSSGTGATTSSGSGAGSPAPGTTASTGTPSGSSGTTSGSGSPSTGGTGSGSGTTSGGTSSASPSGSGSTSGGTSSGTSSGTGPGSGPAPAPAPAPAPGPGSGTTSPASGPSGAGSGSSG